MSIAPLKCLCCSNVLTLSRITRGKILQVWSRHTYVLYVFISSLALQSFVDISSLTGPSVVSSYSSAFDKRLRRSRFDRRVRLKSPNRLVRSGLQPHPGCLVDVMDTKRGQLVKVVMETADENSSRRQLPEVHHQEGGMKFYKYCKLYIFMVSTAPTLPCYCCQSTISTIWLPPIS